MSYRSPPIEVRALITRVYAAFNRRDIDAALAAMSENVNWPTASEGGRVIGKDAIRAYWLRQWAEFDPRVEPTEIIQIADGRFLVKVRQIVKTTQGQMLSDQIVSHVFTLRNGLIEHMVVEEDRPSFTAAH